jgi:hypothetical protein
MRRIIAQWMISRSIDGGRDVPAWVRRWSAGDDETIRFEAAARRLVDALRRDAPAWRALAPNGGEISSRLSTRGLIGWRGFALRWIASGALVCGLLAVGWAWRSRLDVAPNQPQVATVRSADDAALVREDVDWLMAAFDESQTSLVELVDRLDAMMTPPAPGKAFGTQVDAAVEFFAYRLPASTAKVAGLSHATATLESPSLLSRFWLGKRGT